MSLNVLLTGPNEAWIAETKKFLESKFFACETADTGKECQLKIYKGKYYCLVLDLDTEHHSGLEVLSYVRLNAPQIKVMLIIENKERFDSLDLSKDELRALGAGDILIKPFSAEKLIKSIEGENQFEAWKNVKSSGDSKVEEEVNANDDEFTGIKISEFCGGNTTIFDHYLRLGQNKYLKILHKGDFFEAKRLDKYVEDKKVTHLYFKTKDRGIYVNFINGLMSKVALSKAIPTERKLSMARNLAEKYIDEIYTVGLKPQLIEEGKKLANNVYLLINRDPELGNLLKLYQSYDPPAHAHLFLVCFLASITCTNLEWASPRTVQTVALGALLHDIGRLKLPADIRTKHYQDMTDDEKAVYRTHPQLGIEMLEKHSLISEGVRQIVYQHHEYVTGNGFPNQLTSTRIYPLAKVVSLADEFSYFIMSKRIAPLEGLKEFIPNKKIIQRFDPSVVKAMIMAFQGKSKK